MITKVTGEAPFQILTNNFSISPSQEGYTLQISADGKNYSSLFTVGANTTRLVTGVAANSYYRLLGNESEVTINWMKTCVTEGGGGSGSGATYTAGEYISIEQDVISVTGITPDQYLTSADTQDFVTQAYVDAALTAATQDLATENYVDAAITAGTQNLASQGYVDSAITAATQGLATEAYVTAATQGFMTEADVTAITSPIQEQLDDVERVTATAYTELHQDIVDLSGATSGYATHAEVTAATQNMATQGYVTSAITAATQGLATEAYVTAATQGMATQAYVTGITSPMQTAINNKVTNGGGISTIQKISQADYDDLVSGGTVDNSTFYVITGSTS